MGLVHLDCPACGGALSLAEGERIAACRSCGGESLVLRPDAVPRYTIEAAVDRERAAEIAQAALRRPDIPGPLRGRARFEGVSLCYVPFYEAAAVRLGSILVRERVKPPAPLTEGEGSGQALDRWLEEPGEEREDTRIVLQDVLRIAPACRLPELGVERIPLADGRRGGSPIPLTPFDPVALQSRAVVFSPSLPAARFLEETTRRIAGANDATRFVEPRLKLLYYPVWRLRYRHRGRSYELVVDAVAGKLLRGAAPRERAAAAAAGAAGLALAALGLGRLLRSLAGAGGFGPLFPLLAVAGGALAWLAWRWLEAGGEIALGEG
jgi:hypothetical protein